MGVIAIASVFACAVVYPSNGNAPYPFVGDDVALGGAIVADIDVVGLGKGVGAARVVGDVDGYAEGSSCGVGDAWIGVVGGGRGAS